MSLCMSLIYQNGGRKNLKEKVSNLILNSYSGQERRIIQKIKWLNLYQIRKLSGLRPRAGAKQTTLIGQVQNSFLHYHPKATIPCSDSPMMVLFLRTNMTGWFRYVI